MPLSVKARKMIEKVRRITETPIRLGEELEHLGEEAGRGMLRTIREPQRWGGYKCSRCGRPMRGEWRFCPNCGETLKI